MTTSFEGDNLRICRHNSDPIEPPAPVTQTELLVTPDLIDETEEERYLFRGDLQRK